MNFKYYIQKYAIRRCNTIIPLPADVKIDEKYLVDLSDEEFRFALSEIHEIFKRLYNEMYENPESFGMVVYKLAEDYKTARTKLNIDINYGRPSQTEEHKIGVQKTITHFNKFENAIDLIFSSVNSKLTGLSVDYEKLRKLKVRKLPEVLKRLEDQGFEIIEDGAFLNLTHENRDIFKVFSACGLSCLTWGKIAKNQVIKDSCIDFFVSSVFEDEDKKFITDIHDLLLPKGFIYKIKGFSDNIRYTKKGKLEFLSIGFDWTSIVVKIRLANLDKYINILDQVSERVRDNILDAYYCRGCAPCKTKSYQFSYKNKKYVKCCRGCYHFYHLAPDDFPSIKLLLENELVYY